MASEARALTARDIERFEAKRAPANDRGCRLWTGARMPKGYGRFGRFNTAILAHRVAYEIANGPIPPGLFVLHRCDVPACTEPSHLFLGTLVDNNADRDAKGRQHAKVTERDVVAIRAALAAGEPQTSVGRRYGISQTCVSDIHVRRKWRHVV